MEVTDGWQLMDYGIADTALAPNSICTPVTVDDYGCEMLV
jgi:hypothetical protein